MQKMKKKYDLIFSMGAACSCSSALRSAELQVASYPFDWLFGSDFCGRADIVVKDFKRFIDKEDLEFAFSERSIKCDAYHNKYNDLTFNHDFEKGKNLAETYQAVHEKYERRINRLLTNIAKANSVLIVYIETPDSVKSLSDNKIKAAFEKVQRHFNDKHIDLIYLSPDNTLANMHEYKISENIIRLIGNYKSKSVNDVSYAVDARLLKNLLQTRYALRQPLIVTIKKKLLRMFIQFIPSHNKRQILRKKYHLG